MASVGSLILPFETTGSVPVPPPASFLPPAGTPGVVALFEPGHAGSGKTGVPSTGDSFLDIAEARTAITLGGPSGGLGIVNTVPTTSTVSFAERTAKGALHVASAHSGAASPYQSFSVGLGQPRRDYINARSAAGDTFFLGGYWAVTRVTKSGGTAYSTGLPVAALRQTFDLANILEAVGTVGANAWPFPSDGSRFVGSRAETHGAFRYASVAAKGPMASGFAVANNFIVLGARDAITVNAAPSIAAYVIYTENLTASGRTFAQVDAALKADFTQRVLTPGGKYHGDSWTDPTSKLPA